MSAAATPSTIDWTSVDRARPTTDGPYLAFGSVYAPGREQVVRQVFFEPDRESPTPWRYVDGAGNRFGFFPTLWAPLPSVFLYSLAVA